MATKTVIDSNEGPAWRASATLDEAEAIFDKILLDLNSDLAHAGYTLLKSAAEQCDEEWQHPTEEGLERISVRLAETVAVLNAFLSIQDDCATFGVLRLVTLAKESIDEEAIPALKVEVQHV